MRGASTSGERLDARLLQPVLLCKVGSLVCGIPLGTVSETMRPLPLERLSGTASFVEGVSMIRGVPVPVVDLARLLKSESDEPRTRLVVVRMGDSQAALSVHAVLGIRSIRAESFSEMPPLLGAASADIVSAVGALDARLFFVLETARVLSTSCLASPEVGGGAP